uniref:Secreted protein n=1 Tax=Parastrongyloides trichosuri TaxID=131310 RepID=A0A0N4Z7J7_PARTI
MKFITIVTFFAILFVALIGVQGDDNKDLLTPCKQYCKYLEYGEERIKRPNGCVCPHEEKKTVKPESSTEKQTKIDATQKTTTKSVGLWEKIFG